MVCALAKLHNFCIDEGEDQVLPYAPDEAYIEFFGAVPLITQPETGRQGIPLNLLGAGKHFEDVTISD